MPGPPQSPCTLGTLCARPRGGRAPAGAAGRAARKSPPDDLNFENAHRLSSPFAAHVGPPRRPAHPRCGGPPGGPAAGRRRRPAARRGGRQGAACLKADAAQGEHARVGAALRQAAEVHARQRAAQRRGRQAGRALVADVVDCARAHVSLAGSGGAAQNRQPQLDSRALTAREVLARSPAAARRARRRRAAAAHWTSSSAACACCRSPPPRAGAGRWTGTAGGRAAARARSGRRSRAAMSGPPRRGTSWRGPMRRILSRPRARAASDKRKQCPGALWGPSAGTCRALMCVHGAPRSAHPLGSAPLAALCVPQPLQQNLRALHEPLCRATWCGKCWPGHGAPTPSSRGGLWQSGPCPICAPPRPRGAHTGPRVPAKLGRTGRRGPIRLAPRACSDLQVAFMEYLSCGCSGWATRHHTSRDIACRTSCSRRLCTAVRCARVLAILAHQAAECGEGGGQPRALEAPVGGLPCRVGALS